MDPHFFWYLARSAGIVAYLLLAFSTILGLSVTSRLGDGLLGRSWVFEVHKFASLLALAFIGLHLAALLADPWINFNLLDLTLPGISPYRPLPVAVGVLAMYGVVVGAGSFYIKNLLGHKTWRALHYTTFATFTLALLHGVYAGEDSGEPWMKLVYYLSGLLIFFLVVFRAVSEPTAVREVARARSTRDARA